MGSIKDHKIDYNGGGGGFSVVSGIYTAKFDVSILPQGSAKILFEVIRSGFSSTLKIKGKILETSSPDDPAHHSLRSHLHS